MAAGAREAGQQRVLQFVVEGRCVIADQPPYPRHRDLVLIAGSDFVIRYSDCSVNGASGLDNLMQFIAAQKPRRGDDDLDLE
jgi:hypothetical protein